MISILVQGLTLLSGMLVNFLIPALFGLTNYGTFLQVNILVLLIQKLTDIANEPLLSRIEHDLIFPVSLIVCGLVLALFSAVNAVYPIGSPWLLASMLLSSSVLLSLYAVRRLDRILVYLVVFLLVFGTGLALRLFHVLNITIEQLLIATNAVPASIAAFILAAECKRFPRGKELAMIGLGLIRSMPGMLSLTFVYNLLTNVFPFLLSKSLPAGDLGLFRVVSSIVQSATSLFPINPKAIFVTFIRSEDRGQQYRTLASVALLYFATAGLVGYAIASAWPRLHPYLTLICSLPVLYWTVLSERYLLALKRVEHVRRANLLVGLPLFAAMFLVSTVPQATLCYAAGFSIYAITLQYRMPDRLKTSAVFWVCGLSPVAASLLDKNSLFVGAYLIGCIWIALCVTKIRRADLRSFSDAL